MRSTISRWRAWPPTRALEIERGEQLLDEPSLANEPRAFTSEIDPRYPVFGNPLTSTVRRNFAAAREEIEDLYRRIAELEADTGFTLSANLPLTGTGTTANPLRVIPATQLQVNGGTDGTYPVTPATLRALTGDVGSLNTAAGTVTGAINELLTRISALSSPLLLVGTYNAATHIVLASAGSPATTGALPAAAPGNRGWVLIVSVAGTGAAPAPTVPLTASDWLVSDGAVWIHLDLHQPTTHAVNVAISTITGLVATNVQTALEELRLALINVLTTVAVNPPITGNGAATPLGLTVASAADVAGGINALNPITSLTLRGVTGNIASLTTTDKTSLVAAINEVADEVALATTGGLTSVATNASLSGAGTSASPLAVAPASTAQIAAGTDNIQAVTALRMREVTGDLATLTTTAKSNLVAAVNELDDTIANLDLGVTTNASLSGDGTSGTPLQIAPANAAQVTTGSDNIQAITALRLHEVTGTLALLDTADKSALVPAINELATHIATLQSGVTPIGTYDVTTDVVTPFSGSPFGATPGPLPAAATGNKGWYAIVSPNAGTGLGTSEIAGVTVAIGDQLLSSGTSWDHIVLSAATTPASSVAIDPIAGMTASTAQQALAELHTNKLATVAASAPITGNGAGTPLGLSVAGAGDVATGTNNTLPITSATLRGVTGDPAGLTTTVTTNLVAALNGLQTEVDDRLTGNETVTLSGDVTGSGATAITTALATVNTNVGTFQGLTVNAKGLVTAAVDQAYAPLASPPLTGTPTAPTATAGTDTTQVATTAFVKAAVDAIDALPTGGAIYDVLSKASATAGDVEWRGAGVRPNNNTVIGAGAFNPAATGANNVAIGVNAGAANATRSGITAVGANALQGNTGLNNTAVGFNALSSASNSGNNTALGVGALQANVSGGYNTAIGIGSLGANVSGSQNTAVGVDTLGRITSGANNIAIGMNTALWFGVGGADPLTTVNRSIYIGNSINASANGVTNEIAIGYGDTLTPMVGSGSNTITLGNEDITALYTRAGLVLGDDPTGGAKGPGTINCTGPIYVNDVEVGGLPAGGAQYDVLSKASATAGDVEWRGAGVRPNSNTVIGAGAFNLAATGSNNVAIGPSTLTIADTGSNNIAIGQNALQNNNVTSNSNNIAIGTNALRSGSMFTVAIGQNALMSNTGANNTAVGRNSLNGNTAGAGNTGLGYHALANNSVGDGNVAIGANAGELLRSSYNTAVGNASLQAAAALAGDANTALGYWALKSFTAGSNNIGIGVSAGHIDAGDTAITNTSNSIFIGNNSKALAGDSPGQTNQIVIGHEAVGHGSDTITLGNDDVTALYTQGTIYVDGKKIGGFAPSIAWTADTDPDGVSMFVNNTGRALNIAAISGIVEEENGSAATVTVFKAASGTALSAGTPVHGAPFDANLNAGSTQDITPFAGMTLEIGERLGLQATAVTAWEDSVASITVYLEP